jgi:subtilisin family serine protease
MIRLIVLLSLLGQAKPEGGAPPTVPLPADKVHPAVRAELRERAGPLAVWVFFTDKGIGADERPQALAAARAALQPRALHRRQLRRTSPGLVDDRDLPVPDAYVARVADAGGAERTRSRWLGAVSVLADAQAVQAIADLPFVRAIAPVRRRIRIREVPIEVSTAAAPRSAAGTGTGYGPAEAQLQQIGIVALHSAGYTGAGVVIGVLDTGFHLTHEAFNNPLQPISVLSQWDFINGDGNPGIEEGDPAFQHFHGTVVLGTMAGNLPGAYIGGAPDAAFILAKTEDTADEYPAEEDFYVAGLEFVEAGGADLATSSLGYIDWYEYEDLDGQSAVTTIAVNTATDNGMACCTSAGNGGHEGKLPSLVAPADALQVLTCGAVDELGELAGFSSNGPTADGRIKPEVLARGVNTHTVDPFDDAA